MAHVYLKAYSFLKTLFSCSENFNTFRTKKCKKCIQNHGIKGNFTKRIRTKRILTKGILTKRILTKRMLTQSILTLNVYSTKTYTNIPGFSLSASSYFSSLPQAPAFGLG
jgi:hypothetical protein